jgi:hypothetical protein
MTPEKRAVLEDYLGEWYKADLTRKKMLEDVVTGKAGVSLRTIDWFVTNYSVRNPVLYEHEGKLVDVNSDYKDILRCFHKIGFDSFRRRGGAYPSEATLRQRNFFKWAITNGVVEYVLQHSEKIEKDMATAKQEKRKRKCIKSLEEEEDRRPKRQKQKSVPSIVIDSRPKELQIPTSTKLDW